MSDMENDNNPKPWCTGHAHVEVAMFIGLVMTMTRANILNNYTVDAHKIIRTLGKFEGEPIYVPYFWDCAMQGMYAEDVNGVFFMPLDADDHAMWPELYLNSWDGQRDPSNSPVYGIGLEESDSGFVYSAIYATQSEYNDAVKSMEKAEINREF
jgi:hypothetical protein